MHNLIINVLKKPKTTVLPWGGLHLGLHRLHPTIVINDASLWGPEISDQLSWVMWYEQRIQEIPQEYMPLTSSIMV